MILNLEKKLINSIYMIGMPLWKLIFHSEKRKREDLKAKAKSLSYEEVANMIFKRIIKYVKKNGRFNKEIIVFDEDRAYGVIDYDMLYSFDYFLMEICTIDYNTDKLLESWRDYCFPYNANDKEKILSILADLLKEFDSDCVESHIIEKNTAKFSNYKKNIKINIEC